MRNENVCTECNGLHGKEMINGCTCHCPTCYQKENGQVLELLQATQNNNWGQWLQENKHKLDRATLENIMIELAYQLHDISDTLGEVDKEQSNIIKRDLYNGLSDKLID